jgi:lipoyl(octanoyl) transferase
MANHGGKRLLRIDLGRTKYYDAWILQKKLVDLRFNNKIPDCLLFTEHDPVITRGRGTNKNNLLVSPADLGLSISIWWM